MRLDPNDSFPYLNRGLLLVEEKSFEAAIKDYSKAIEIDPKAFKAYGARGLAYLHLGKEGEAKRDFDMALQLNPQFGGQLDLEINKVRSQKKNP